MEQFAHERGDERAGVDVIRVHLIENHDLTGEGETADEKVFHRDHALQGLVDSADAVGREQGLLGGGEP